MTKIITISGKGGVGKTTLSALILDELARYGYGGRILAVDGDPATTLYLALGFAEPEATLATIRDTTRLDAKTVRDLPGGVTPAQYVARQLQQVHVLKKYQLRSIFFDMLAMGWGEGAGCYCNINNALSQVLHQIVASYDVILIDNEAGLEHLSRYRLNRADVFITVATQDETSQKVAKRIMNVAAAVKMEIGDHWAIMNRYLGVVGVGSATSHMLGIPSDKALLTRQDVPPVKLADNSPVRAALAPLIDGLLESFKAPVGQVLEIPVAMTF